MKEKNTATAQAHNGNNQQIETTEPSVVRLRKSLTRTALVPLPPPGEPLKKSWKTVCNHVFSVLGGTGGRYQQQIMSVCVFCVWGIAKAIPRVHVGGEFATLCTPSTKNNTKQVRQEVRRFLAQGGMSASAKPDKFVWKPKAGAFEI